MKTFILLELTYFRPSNLGDFRYTIYPSPQESSLNPNNLLRHFHKHIKKREAENQNNIKHKIKKKTLPPKITYLRGQELSLILIRFKKGSQVDSNLGFDSYQHPKVLKRNKLYLTMHKTISKLEEGRVNINPNQNALMKINP